MDLSVFRGLSVLAALAGVGFCISQCATGFVPIDDGNPAATNTSREGGAPKGDAGCTATCGGKCVNTATDSTNCGVCNNVCLAPSTCVAGKCACSTGSLCQGGCVDTQTDANNCGMCGNSCADAGAGTWSCVAGQCTLGCTGGQTACSGTCYDLTNTDQHCGSCTTDCTSSSQSCCSSACVDTQSDKNNCGSCGMKCPTSACSSGKCCSNPPMGSCGQSLCTDTGFPLFPGCDGKGCVNAVCSVDSFCCDVDWDSSCVSEVDTFCKGYSCGC